MDFILSDESINSYGFKVLTRGINLDRFKQNPVMYYNHNQESGVIGRWENIRIEDSKLLAKPVFDLNDPLGAKIAKKVEDGFIKGASITISDTDIAEIEGEFIVLSCVIKECSICDIPSNGNALKLFVDNEPVNPNIGLLKLSISKNNQTQEFLKPIKTILGLSDKSTMEDIIHSITALKKETDVESIISEAIKLNIVTSDDRESLIQLAKSNSKAFTSFINNRKEKLIEVRKKEANTLILSAIREGRINADNDGIIKEGWIELFNKDFDTTKRLLSALPIRVPVMRQIEQANNKGDRSQWTLNDYRKKDPKALQNNPELFQQLLELEKQN